MMRRGVLQVQIFFDCLLYFTSFGAMFALFASILSIVIWLLKTLWSWMTAEPETDVGKSKQFHSPNLDCFKRAGQ
jgi:hypothetical protein